MRPGSRGYVGGGLQPPGTGMRMGTGKKESIAPQDRRKVGRDLGSRQQYMADSREEQHTAHEATSWSGRKYICSSFPTLRRIRALFVPAVPAAAAPPSGRGILDPSTDAFARRDVGMHHGPQASAEAAPCPGG